MLETVQESLFRFLHTTIFSNTIQQWLLAFGLVLLCIAVGVVFLRILRPILRFFTSKTETVLDDIFVDAIEEPITVLLVALGIRVSLSYALSLSELNFFRLDNVIQVFVPAVVFVWFVTRFYESLHHQYDLSLKYLVISRVFFLIGVLAIALLVVVTWIIQPTNCYRNCVGANLVARNMRGFDLRGSNFVGAVLRDSDLGGADLRRADLSGADLVGVNFNNADLSNAVLIGADLSGADLRGAILKSTDLSGAVLSGADLTRTDLTEARLRGVTFDSAQLIEVDMHGTDLIGGSFSRANSPGSDFSQADLSGANLSGSDLSGALLENADFSGAAMNLVNMNGANLRNANLSGASLIGSNLAATNLSNSQLSGSILVGADLSGANLNTANLSDARMFIAELDEQDFLSDPVLLELNELQRSEIVKDINLGGVKFNVQTRWPVGKEVLLSSILGHLFEPNVTANDVIPLLDTPVSEDGVRLNPVVPAEVQGDIVVAGSGTVAFLTEPVAAFFEEQGYQGEITTENFGTDVGFIRFCEEGNADIVTASRLITPEESQICSDNGYDLVPFPFGLDSIIVAVNPSNTFLSNATTEELAAIFTAQQWSDINPAWPDRDIIHVMPDTVSGTFDAFVDLVFDGDSESLVNAPNLQMSGRSSDQIWGIVNNPDAVGFLSRAYYQQHSDLVKPITIDGTAPTSETVANGEYPLARPLLLYTTIDIIQKKPQVGSFMNFFLTHVNALMEPLGYFPVAADEIDATKMMLMNISP